MMETINGITQNGLWTFVCVAVILAGVALTVCNLIKTVRELRKPKQMSEKTVDDKLANDNKRIEDLQEVTKKQAEILTILLRSNMAMIHHMLDGNNTAGLKEMQSQIEDFLAYGTIKKL